MTRPLRDESLGTRWRRTARSAPACLFPIALCWLLAEPAEAQEDQSATPSDAAEREPPHETSEDTGAAWFVETALQARVNPLGLTLATNGGYRIPLYGQSHLLLDGSHVDLGVTTQVSPGYIWVGPMVVISPLSILVLRASAQRLHYFGTFGYIHEYGDLDANWSPGRQADIDEAGLGRGVGGDLVEVGATLQLLVGCVAVLVTSRYSWLWMDVRSAYVEPYFDMLLEPSDGVWTNTTIAGYVLGDLLLLGGLWEHSRSREGRFQRDFAGPLVLWEIPATGWLWGAPQVAAFVGFYARDPYRRSEALFGLELSLRF